MDDDRESAITDPALVSITIPVFNENAVLPKLLERLAAIARSLKYKYRFEFIFVDDGSDDNSLDVLRGLASQDSRVRILELRRNYGQTAALQAAFDTARGAIIISMDADLQHFPEDIPLFLEKIEAGSDVVCGWRHQRREGVIRRWPSKIANILIRRVSGVSVHDIGTTFRAYRAEIIRELFLLGENHRFVPVFAKMAGARIDEVTIENIPRPAGESSYGLSRTVNVFLDLFFLYFYTHHLDRPLRLFGKIALLLFLFGGVIASWLLILALVYNIPSVREHSGWFVLSMVMFLTGVQLILIGIVAEVLARLYFQPGKRTRYRVRREWGNVASSGVES
ncbi:MAG: glycosyltransferase family 2 protein [Gammaproteobacteria bacterium]